MEEFKPIYLNLKGFQGIEISGATSTPIATALRKPVYAMTNDSFENQATGPMVLNTKLVEINRNYRGLETTNQKYTYKFTSKNDLAKNRNLVFQNF